MKVTDKISRNMFREYDLRGIYGEDIYEDVSYTIGRGMGTYIKKYGYDTVLVGHDNRLSSPMIHQALIQGILDSGSNVVDLGLVTTPMYYYARKFYQIPSGIMITASHNPKEYNGFKISFEEIGNACGEEIIAFRDFIFEGKFDSGNGILESRDIHDAYVDLLTQNLDFGNRKVKVVVDCGNGTGSIIIRDIFDRLGIEYYPLYCESDGNFPNHHPDPIVKENMIDLSHKIRELGYDLGIGIDGDADRVAIYDEQGKIVLTDLYMAIMYRYLNPYLKNRKGLFDVKCSKSLIDVLESLDIEPVMYRTGNSYTGRMVQEGNFDFGGEYSGHVFFHDKFPGIDDGIYGGLRMIELLSHSEKSVSQLLEGIPVYYATDEIKIATTEEKKFEIVDFVCRYAKERGYDMLTIDGVRVSFIDGWALVRASNTGPNVTVRFEASSKSRLQEIMDEFMNVIHQIQ